jgi:hypothetical protein
VLTTAPGVQFYSGGPLLIVALPSPGTQMKARLLTRQGAVLRGGRGGGGSKPGLLLVVAWPSFA